MLWVNVLFTAAMAPVRLEMCPDGRTPLCMPGQHAGGPESRSVGCWSAVTGLFICIAFLDPEPSSGYGHARAGCVRHVVFAVCQPHEPCPD